MLPVPSPGTPFIDILEFKQRRKDELLEFRTYLDDIYQKIINSADIPRSKNTEISKLETAIKNLDETLSESGISRTVTSLRATLNSDFLGIAGIGLSIGLTAIPYASQIPMTPLALGMTGAGILASIKAFSMPDPSNCTVGLNYLSSVRNNFTN